MADQDLKLNWNDAPLSAQLEARFVQRLKQGGVHLQGAIRERINIGAPRDPNSKTVRFTAGSPPGDPPYKRSNRLFKSIAVSDPVKTGSTLTIRVGSNLKYARRLELGFTGVDSLGRNVNQAPRPYLRSTLLLEQRVIAGIILAP